MTENQTRNTESDAVRRLLGEFYDQVEKGEAAAAVLSELAGLLVGKGITVAFVGPTNAGKTTLLNGLFGRDVAEVAARADTTQALAVVDLPSRVRLVDTPGTSGAEENEAVTAAYLGIEGTGAPLPELVRLTSISLGANGSVCEETVAFPTASDSLDALRPDLVLFCVPPDRGGLIRDDKTLLRQLRRQRRFDTIVVVTKEGSVTPGEFKDVLSEVQADAEGHDMSVLAADVVTGKGMDLLVSAMLERADGADIGRLNAAVESQFQARRSDALNVYLRRVAARGACMASGYKGVDNPGALPAAFVRAAVYHVVATLNVATPSWDGPSLESRIEIIAKGKHLSLDIPPVESMELDVQQEDMVAEMILLLPRLLGLLGGLAIDPRVSAADKALVGVAIAYVVNPIDIIPDIIPFFGMVDDVLVVASALARLVVRSGWEVIYDHYSGDRDLLRVLIFDVPNAVLSILPNPVFERIRRFIGYDEMGELPALPPPPVAKPDEVSISYRFYGALGSDFVRLLYRTLLLAIPDGSEQANAVDEFIDGCASKLDDLAGERDEARFVDTLEGLRIDFK